MIITDHQAIVIQNLRADSCATSNDKAGTWAQLMLFDDGSTVLIQGTLRGRLPGLFTEVYYASEGTPFEPMGEKTYHSLVGRYYREGKPQ